MSYKFIDKSVESQCYAVEYSYGEICVGCNCCGKYVKGIEMWKARKDYHSQQLSRNISFNHWCIGHQDIINMQKRNGKSDISYHKKKIKICKNVIKMLLKEG